MAAEPKIHRNRQLSGTIFEDITESSGLFHLGKARQTEALRGYREVTAGNNVFCTNPLEQHFGVDASGRYDIVVKFPSGIEKIMKNVEAGKTYGIREEVEVK